MKSGDIDQDELGILPDDCAFGFDGGDGVTR
jgi:hypothetical protein